MEKKDHKNICSCDLMFGECLAKLNWTIDRLRQKWKTSYVDFDTAIAKVLDQDPCFINFDEIGIYHVDEFESLLQKYFFLEMESICQRLDLAEILVNVWCFSEHVFHTNSNADCICPKHLKECIEEAKKRWTDDYKDFSDVIMGIELHDEKFVDVFIKVINFE